MSGEETDAGVVPGAAAGLPVAAPTIMLVAVEPSGDAIGAALIRALRAELPGVRLVGCGGPKMREEGFESWFPIDRFAVIGPVEALRVWREAELRGAELAARAAAEGVDAGVFIDAWSFSKLAAERIRKSRPDMRLYKLVAPQVWASRPTRVRHVKALFDGVLCLFPFEPQWFERAGVRTAFIGNPNFQDAWRSRGDGARFRAGRALGDRPLLLIAPGSRRAEIVRHLEVLRQAVALIAARVADLAVAMPVAPQVAAEVARRVRRWPIAPILVGPEEKNDAFAAATAAIAKSGTVTTELAINRVPMVVVYRVDPATALWIRAVLRTPFVSILNITAGRFVAPELLQGDCTPEKIAGAVLPLLAGGEARTQQLEDFPPLLASLGVDGPPAAVLAARRLRDWLARPRRQPVR